tara:strand:+ start:920 stop:1465 length:546 start_codon:yes stop_codon:yes gene_type:complete
MAHFIKLDENNIVVDSFVIHDNELKDNENNEQEILGIKFCVKLFGDANYKQTSYNTAGGVHLLGGTPFRKNYAGLGYTYDESKDAFIEPKPYSSWTLNEETCIWEAPVDKPENEQFYIWDETTTSWIVPPDLAPYPSWIRNEETSIWEAPVAYPQDGIFYIWDEMTTSWIVRTNNNRFFLI